LPNPITLINIGKILVMQQRYSEAANLFDKALHDRTLNGPARKTAEAELEATKKFQGMRLDMLATRPPINPVRAWDQNSARLVNGVRVGA